MKDPAVRAESLGKTYVKRKALGDLLRRPFAPAERVRALDHVDLAVGRGEIVGLLGPNGAGKTTLIKILASLVLPTNGRALIEGADPVAGPEARRRLGLITSDERSFYWRLTGVENLRFFARLHGLPGALMRERIPVLIERVGLASEASRRFGEYSAGMKQRLALARALLHDPPVLLLDEPTRSLDPVAGRAFRRFVKDELNGRDGKTVLLATHNLREAEAMCDRVAILARGRIVTTSSPEGVRRMGLPGDLYRLEIRGDVPVGAHPGLRVTATDEQDRRIARAELLLRDGEILGEALGRLSAAGLEVLTCDRLEPDLEDAFERLVAGRQEPPAGAGDDGGRGGGGSEGGGERQGKGRGGPGGGEEREGGVS